MRFNSFWKICANWSTTSRKSDSTEYAVLKYTHYTDRLEDFIRKYPTVTIEANCKTKSDCLDDQYCSETLWTYETQNFINTEYKNEYLVNAWKNGFGWDVGSEIGFGFKVKDDTLMLRPFINGWIYKAGAYWSCLDFGLGAYKITFNPDDDHKGQIISVVLLD